jgi:hypothetical protein
METDAENNATGDATHKAAATWITRRNGKDKGHGGMRQATLPLGAVRLHANSISNSGLLFLEKTLGY